MHFGNRINVIRFRMHPEKYNSGNLSVLSDLKVSTKHKRAKQQLAPLLVHIVATTALLFVLKKWSEHFKDLWNNSPG